MIIEKYDKKSDIHFEGLKLVLTIDLAQVPAVLKIAFGDIEKAQNILTSMNCFILFGIFFFWKQTKGKLMQMMILFIN